MLWNGLHWIAVAVFLTASIASQASEPGAGGGQSSAEDPRQLVSMPAEAQQLLRKDMIDHLTVLNQIFAHLAANELQQASELAESRLGNSSMGRHRGTGMGPGRFMPPEMHRLGIGMHQAASDFAATATHEKPADAYGALQGVTSFCVACHASFRTR